MRRSSTSSPAKPRPPVKNGVGPSTVALPDGKWLSLIDFLEHRFPAIPRSEWLDRIVRGDVLDEHCNSVSADEPYRPNTKAHYYRRKEDEPQVPFQEVVLFQDEYLVVADKPHFLPVISTGRYVLESLLVRLKRRLGIDELVPLHRIDRDTAGIVLFAIQPATRDRYMKLFRHRAIRKYYEAVAPYRADLKLPLHYRSRLVEGDSFMQMRSVDGEPNSESSIELLEVRDTPSENSMARYGLAPITGKKHQLRVHMAALGIPSANDRIYPTLLPAAKTPEEFAEEYRHPLQLLAKRIEFIDPVTQSQRSFVSQQTLQW